jgi:thioredoxin reductase (NADPH)
MVGGGDSAATEALHLKKIGVNVMIAHRSGKLRAQKHLQKLLNENGIRVLYNTEVVEIQGEAQVTGVELMDKEKEKTYVQPVDGVFHLHRLPPAVELANKLGVELTDQGYIKTDTPTTAPAARASMPPVMCKVVSSRSSPPPARAQPRPLSIFEDLVTPYWVGGDKKEAAG